jgi:hypothetical protein
LIAVLLMSPATVAFGKESPVEVCGADGCVQVLDRGLRGFLHSTGARGPAPDPAPFYVVRFRADASSRAPITWSYVYVPSAKAMRGTAFGSGPVRWMRAAFLAPAFDAFADDLDPYPASSTWTPRVPPPDDRFSLPWLALGLLGAITAGALAWAIHRTRALPPTAAFAPVPRGRLGAGPPAPGSDRQTAHRRTPDRGGARHGRA